MSETPLDSIRRNIREAEERLKINNAAAGQTAQASPPAPDEVLNGRIEPLQNKRESSIPVIVMSKDGALLEVNESACDWLGIRRGDISTIRLQDFLHPDSQGDFDRLFKHALQMRPAADAYCRFQGHNRIEFQARIILAGVTDAHGMTYRILGMLER